MAAFPARIMVALLAVGLLPAGAGDALGAVAQQAFPHDLHERLFPLCEGCHLVGTGDPADLYPSPSQCQQCHDGEQEPEVDWSPPSGPPDYRHPAHEEATGVALACGDCHGGDGGVALDELGASCSSCHREHHTEEARCRVCHQGPLREEHEARAHAGCDGCHEAAWVEELSFNRELCLVCHRDMEDHKPGRPCGQCHAVGQPGR